MDGDEPQWMEWGVSYFQTKPFGWGELTMHVRGAHQAHQKGETPVIMRTVGRF